MEDSPSTQESNNSPATENLGKGEGKQGEDSKKHDPDWIARKIGNRTTRKILAQLRNQDYVYSIAKDLGISKSKVYYHLYKIQEYDLVEETGEEDRRKFYRLNSLGESVLERCNIPDE
ncbi:MAG: ArsR/SmtB family transcription factor [Candidatus Nanohaloarchaea archaeon]